MKDHYDVGILGVWYGCNYGSIATYYALQQTIEKLGYSTLMVHYPRLKPDDGRMKGRHSIRFAEEHYDISLSYHVSEIGELNKYCDAFVLGSDQLWNYGVTKIFGHSYFLDFAGDDKKKIAYATSFGSGDFQAPKDFTEKAVKCMRRMNAISVREKSETDGTCTIHSVGFYQKSSGRKAGAEIVTIYALYGAARQEQVEARGLTSLYSDTDMILAVEINEDTAPWEGTVSVAQLSERFHVEAAENH